MCKKCDTYDRDHIMLSTNFYFQVVAIYYLMINGIYDKNFRMRGSAAYSQKYFTWGIRLLLSWIVEKVGAINANFSLTVLHIDFLQTFILRFQSFLVSNFFNLRTTFGLA